MKTLESHEEATPSPKVISLFSGAMGLDLGLEKAGLDTAVCVDFDKFCAETIRINRPNLPVIHADLATVTTQEILSAAGLAVGEAFAVVGGPPCQSFSTGGLRQSIQDKRGNLFAEFHRVVAESRPSYFVFENVAQILTAAIKHRPIAERPGQRWHLASYKVASGQLTLSDDLSPLSKEEQSGSALDVILDSFAELGYSLNFGVLNSADFGVSQRRLRFVLIGSRLNPQVPLPEPTHSREGAGELPVWRNLRDAIGSLQEASPEHSNYSPEFQEFFSLIQPGGNWRSLPVDLQKKALGEKAFVAGGGKTGFFRRLSWDEPSPTIVGKPNRKSHAMCHPEVIRPLTVRECARIQGFRDDWEFSGGMHAKYLQIGNAVPVGLGEAIGRTLLKAYAQHAERPLPDVIDLGAWKSERESMLSRAHLVLQAAARNKVSKRA